jgi:hypothetical protein
MLDPPLVGFPDAEARLDRPGNAPGALDVTAQRGLRAGQGALEKNRNAHTTPLATMAADIGRRHVEPVVAQLLGKLQPQLLTQGLDGALLRRLGRLYPPPAAVGETALEYAARIALADPSLGRSLLVLVRRRGRVLYERDVPTAELRRYRRTLRLVRRRLARSPVNRPEVGPSPPRTAP